MKTRSYKLKKKESHKFNNINAINTAAYAQVNYSKYCKTKTVKRNIILFNSINATLVLHFGVSSLPLV